MLNMQSSSQSSGLAAAKPNTAQPDQMTGQGFCCRTAPLFPGEQMLSQQVRTLQITSGTNMQLHMPRSVLMQPHLLHL